MSSKFIGIKEARPVLGDLVTATQQGTDVVLTRNGKPAARIVRYEESAMTNIKIGTWAYSIGTGDSPEDTVNIAMRDTPGDYDTEGLIEAYRRKIDQALPGGVQLIGNEFWGPETIESPSHYPTDTDGNIDIEAIVKNHVPLREMLAAFDRSLHYADRQEAREICGL